jgi:hypothetical protein
LVWNHGPTEAPVVALHSVQCSIMGFELRNIVEVSLISNCF